MTTSRDAGEDLLRILDELAELISSARSMPMSASAIVNRENALHLIDRARDAVPSAVRRAEKIVADADAVLAEGRAESERLVQYAQEESERLVAGENIVRMAEDRAREIVSEAKRSAASLREGADDYVASSLDELAHLISDLSRRTDAGRRKIAERRGVDVTDVDLTND